ncbi:MAG TPA: chemotaxis protein CheB [Steroidobacteraceae bacterium]|nr:chemotaxis protein CheB [Steroidobacteraceae bacterium]
MSRAVDLVVIGGSAGAIEVLHRVIDRLPPDFAPATAIVIHVPPQGPNLLAEIFTTPDGLKAKLAEDKEPIVGGTIYFAAPDYHLLVEKGGTFALSMDARVHFSRPAIDVLFETAAEAYGNRLLGVILSGANADGAAGLQAIARAGGITAVQSLESAEVIAMPAAALQAVPGSIEVDADALVELLKKCGEEDGR